MASILILHPGQMGAAIGKTLLAQGHDARWLPIGRSAPTGRRAAEAGLAESREWGDVEVVLSICPPDAALAVARQVAGFTGLYIDANAISPGESARVDRVVTDGGARFADGSVIGPPPTRPGRTQLYLSGAAADEAAALFQGSLLETSVLRSGPFAASSLKMSYAAWTKISAALVLSVQATADALGVGAELVAQWARSQPALADRHASALASAEGKGWRWKGEMDQIAATFAEIGQPAGFGEAAAAVFGQYPRIDE
jgi:3-hydroxyisobutyrate dehydrogenase-like beta-hydroxyacid dehydrogenase